LRSRRSLIDPQASHQLIAIAEIQLEIEDARPAMDLLAGTNTSERRDR
jgi:hypothetical protein